MSAHTPGPWTWLISPNGRLSLTAREKAVLHCPDAPISCDPNDARLITTAPEGLALAVAIVTYFGTADLVIHSSQVDRLLRDQARALIAKAAGL